MRPDSIRTFDWMGKYRPGCRYDLGRNELFEQDLSEIGIDTSYENYRKEKDPEGFFIRTVSETYNVDEKCVIPTIGGTEGIFLASAHIANISPRILIPVPEYEPVFAVPAALGGNVVKGSMDHIISLAGIDDSAMFTSPSNPEGLPRTEFAEAMISAAGHGSRIYVDETFTEFLFHDSPETLFHSDDRIIASGTMTKFFGMTKIRTGWVIAHEEDAASIRRYKSMASAANPRYDLWLAANIMENRQKYASIVNDIVSRNLPVADRFVSGLSYLSWTRPNSAPFGFVRYSLDIDSEALCTMIYEKTGILLVPGTYFGENHGFRLCFFLRPDELKEAFALLESFFKDSFGT